ncbi:DNA polymerase III subunit beta [Bacillus velezensis YAU B9601-Y2]|uniref:DNA polymerase III subunit beta n=1 Tax=Bacillus amyloliquefaciens (strain Y2) TaxID=1155777 RepID=I2CBM2_BACAY|nr:DNA polymerase III subunit beta [Bacillus velezensis YAU B9601-Y2]
MFLLKRRGDQPPHRNNRATPAGWHPPRRKAQTRSRFAGG